MKETVLKIIKEALDKEGIEFFLQYGTALGAYRDNKLIGHDKDIDIGTFGMEDMGRAKEALKKAGFVKAYKPETRKWLNFKHSGVRVDYDFWKWVEIDGVWRNFWKDNEPRDRLPAQFNKLKTIIFLGEEYKIPDKIEEYLAYFYGNWRIKSRRHADPTRLKPV